MRRTLALIAALLAGFALGVFVGNDNAIAQVIPVLVGAHSRLVGHTTGPKSLPIYDIGIWQPPQTGVGTFTMTVGGVPTTYMVIMRSGYTSG